LFRLNSDSHVLSSSAWRLCLVGKPAIFTHHVEAHVDLVGNLGIIRPAKLAILDGEGAQTVNVRVAEPDLRSPSLPTPTQRVGVLVPLAIRLLDEIVHLPRVPGIDLDHLDITHHFPRPCLNSLILADWPNARDAFGTRTGRSLAVPLWNPRVESEFL